MSLISIGFMLMVTYIVFQSRYFIIGPQIRLVDEPSLRQNSRAIVLSGDAYNISRLWVNDRQIFTDAQGRFHETLILENGYTTVALKAEDRYGRKTLVTRQYMYNPSSFIQ